MYLLDGSRIFHMVSIFGTRVNIVGLVKNDKLTTQLENRYNQCLADFDRFFVM